MHFPEKQAYPTLQVKFLANGRIASSQVSAADPDRGSSGLVEYSILSGNQGQVFQMDSLSGAVTANAIMDHELAGAYRSVPDSDL